MRLAYAVDEVTDCCERVLDLVAEQRRKHFFLLHCMASRHQLQEGNAPLALEKPQKSGARREVHEYPLQHEGMAMRGRVGPRPRADHERRSAEQDELCRVHHFQNRMCHLRIFSLKQLIK